MYQSSMSQKNYYMVSIILNGFVVSNFAEVNRYNGWKSIGDVGGFIFFLVILHTMAMIVAGLFLDNKSYFLSPSPSIGSAPETTSLLSPQKS